MNLENFPTRETAKDMLGMISPIYDRSYVGKWIFEVMALYLAQAQDAVKDLEKQAFPETATWALPWWEYRYGIPTNENLSIEERQRAVTQRRNLQVPMNPFRITEIVKSMTGRDVELRENVAPHTYEITIFPGDSNVDLDAVEDMVGKIKQAQKHVNIVFEVPVGVQIQFDVRRQVFDYRLPGDSKKAGRWPQPSFVGMVARADITVDPDGSGAVFPYVPTGTRPDISTIGAVLPVNIEIDPTDTSQPFPYPVAGTVPDVSVIGKVDGLGINIEPDAAAQEFVYQTAGEHKKAGKYPDVSITGETAAPGVNAHITGETASIVYRICGAKRL